MMPFSPFPIPLPILLLLAAALSGAPARPNTEPELGLVHWGRDLDAALAQARREARPVLLLFDEVPGCSTCVGFGRQVLSHPLLVEAMEHEFVPVFVANNRPGRDAELLRRFGEPAWNNPVVRFLDGGGRDVLPRRDGLYSPHEIADRLIEALKASGRPVPGYLAIAEEESRPARRREATFVMDCFWTGEAKLGTIPGVLDVRAVHTDRGEGVRVVYDESRIDRATLEREATSWSCALHEKASGREREAGESDHLHALAHSPLRSLALTPLQAIRVNAAIELGQDARRWLTPSQLAEAGLAPKPRGAARAPAAARPAGQGPVLKR